MALTAERLRSLLSYDPASGRFFWVEAQGAKKAGSVAGSRGPHGCVQIRVDGKLYLAHRLAWLHIFGRFPVLSIDHIDGNPGNNAMSNLREVSHLVNMRNMKRHCTNTSGYSGVSFHPQTGKWRARMYVNATTKNIGLFATKEDAARARKQAEREHGFHENHGRAMQ